VQKSFLCTLSFPLGNLKTEVFNLVDSVMSFESPENVTIPKKEEKKAKKTTLYKKIMKGLKIHV